VQDNTQQRIIDVQLGIVLNEAQFSEFIHEKIDSGARVPIISASIPYVTLGSIF
jgi:hypothetical protein